MVQRNRVLVIHFLDNAQQLRDPSTLRSSVRQAAQLADTLRILIYVPSLREIASPTSYWNVLQSFLTDLYGEAATVAEEKENILMDIDVVLRDMLDETVDTGPWDGAFFSMPASDEQSKILSRFPIQHTSFKVKVPESPSSIPEALPLNSDASYPVVALGGTFDHLHAGHKILLSMSAWIASRKVIVGITDDALLENKSNREVLESIATRTGKVSAFLNLFKPGLEYDVVPIQDVYGPTAWDPDIQALVVSKETMNGANSIAKLRGEKRLPMLKTLIIEVISPNARVMNSEDAKYLRDAKMSSTSIRQWIVQQRKNGPAATTPIHMPGGWVEDGSEN